MIYQKISQLHISRKRGLNFKQSFSGSSRKPNSKMPAVLKRRFKTDSDTSITLSAKDHSHSEMDAIIAKSKKLDQAEKDAIYAYSGSDYTGINHVLYKVDKNGLNGYENGTYKGHYLDYIKGLDSATNQKISKPLTLYRGENIKAISNMLGGKAITDASLKSLEGKVMEFKGFASTAYKASSSFSGKPVFVEINAPKGVQGRVITDLSQYKKSEAELLLHNSGGLHLKKVYKDKKTGQIIIKADYVY